MKIKTEIKELNNLAELEEINLFLDKFNSLINFLEQENIKKHNDNLTKLLKTSISYQLSINRKNQSEQIFYRELDYSQRLTVASCFILVLENSTYLFKNNKLANETLKFFERVFSENKWMKTSNGYNSFSSFQKILFLQEIIRRQFDIIKRDLESIYDIN